MDSAYLPLNGADVLPDALRLAKARQTIRLLQSVPPLPFAALVACRQAEGELLQEAVIVDLDIEVSQHPRHDIRRTERIALVFTDQDTLPADALALREDFPLVPHLNLRPFEHPRSLCLSEEPWSEANLRWTPRGFVEDVRTWLKLTAEGVLHQHDQPLEPLLGGLPKTIILPSGLFATGTAGCEHLFVHSVDAGGQKTVLKASREPEAIGGSQAPAFIALALQSEPHTHGVISFQPGTLKELHAFLTPVGTDLLGNLRLRLRAWEGRPDYLQARLIFLISLPKKREEAGEVEGRELWGFITDSTLQDVAVAVGIWGIFEGKRGVLLNVDTTRQGEDVALELLLPYFSLSRQAASSFNGLPNRYDKKVTAVGMGALGSHIFTILAREGFGEWTLIDEDHLLPHNLARHALNGNAVGFAKAQALAINMNGTIDGPDIAQALCLDVLDPAQSEVLSALYGDSDVLLDISASVAVARHLACDVCSAARRISAFLSPSGSDLVVLAEDRERAVPLDSLEMQYYRALAATPDLEHHLSTNDGRIRYGHSCRDVSSRISEELAVLHSAIASRAIRTAVAESDAAITLWHADGDLGVQRIPIVPARTITVQCGEWTICTDRWVMDKVERLRVERLPAETGGVLIGSYDMQRRIVYVADTIPSPPDSDEQPTVYIRGSEGLRDEVVRISRATAGWLENVGEWHSHPDGYSTAYSSHDEELFGWLTELMAVDGHPALMLIVGQNERSWYIDTLPTR